MSFQRWWAKQYQPPKKVLNIGSCDDPAALGVRDMPPGLNLNVTHFDMDYWPLPNFVQGDAHDLLAAGIQPESYDLVIMGDIHEHLRDPLRATLEAARVVKVGGVLVMTIFEEWRLPKGQHIEDGIALGESHTRAAGYPSYFEYMALKFPDAKIVADQVQPHHFHINMFTDDDVNKLVANVQGMGFTVGAFYKVPEAIHEGYEWFNWLIAMERVQ